MRERKKAGEVINYEKVLKAFIVINSLQVTMTPSYKFLDDKSVRELGIAERNTDIQSFQMHHMMNESSIKNPNDYALNMAEHHQVIGSLSPLSLESEGPHEGNEEGNQSPRYCPDTLGKVASSAGHLIPLENPDISLKNCRITQGSQS